MQEKLSIQQIKKVLNISYPTALKYAKTHGNLEDVAPSGKWYVDIQIVRKQILGEIADANNKLCLLDEVAEVLSK